MPSVFVARFSTLWVLLKRRIDKLLLRFNGLLNIVEVRSVTRLFLEIRDTWHLRNIYQKNIFNLWVILSSFVLNGRKNKAKLVKDDTNFESVECNCVSFLLLHFFWSLEKMHHCLRVLLIIFLSVLSQPFPMLSLSFHSLSSPQKQS